MNTTSRMASGLAFTPEKDLAMFAEMAADGKQLSGLSTLAHGWRFVDADPENAIFDLAYEDDPAPDYFEIFAAAGWTLVLSMGNAHIFKAAPGTPQVHSTLESRREEMLRQRNRFARYSVVTLIAFVLIGRGVMLADWNSWVEMAVLVIAAIPVIYTVVPLIGYWNRAQKLS